MPVSKNGKPYYTKEQYRYARYETSALEYAQSRGYALVRQNSYYHLAEHDSMVFAPNGSWFWNSRGLQGGALEFCMYYEDKTLTEAVLTLAGELERQPPRREPQPKALEKPQNDPEKRFTLPERSKDFRRMFAYLCKTRGLDKDTIMDMIRQKRLYEAVSKIGDMEIHNAAFVYLDPQGSPVGAFLRGLDPTKAFKRDVPGSDKSYGWLLPGTGDVKTVCVFESAIDAASHASLTKAPNLDRLSLEGLSPTPLRNYLAARPEIQDIVLCLDTDQPGRSAAQRLQAEFSAQGRQIIDGSPQLGKDWNEMLLAIRQQSSEPAQAAKSPEP